MVVAAVDIRGQGILAGVATRTVPAVVAKGDRLGQRHVEAERSSDAGGNLGDLEGMGQSGALVVVGKHEHLRLAGQPAERTGVQDAIAVALEACAPSIRSLL